MRDGRSCFLGCAAMVLLLAGCIAPAPPDQVSQADAPAQRVQPKRVTAAISGEAFTLNYAISSSAARTPPGSEALEELVHAGLSTLDNRGLLVPRLAQAVPTTQNGLWKLLSDGRMETTWQLRDNVVWHDGEPMTAEDLAFTMMVVQDPEIAVFRDRIYDRIEHVEVPDARTVTVRWRAPYIGADTLFSPRLSMPQPRHILERAYHESKTGYAELPYWTSEFVGAGPYRVREWVSGSHLLLRASDGYVLGRPHIDELEVKFITDMNTLLANLMAGTVDFMLGRGLSLEQAVQTRDRWKEGRMEAAPYTWIQMWPQLLNPTPAVLSAPQFRRSLLHAVDRQQLVDTLMAGLTSVAHSYLSPSDADFQEVDKVVLRYEYDPRRAAQLVEELGYTRGAEGMFINQDGERLTVELKANAGDDLRENLLFAIADQWQRVGIGVEPFLVPPQLARDDEFSATFPGLWLTQRPNGLATLSNLHSKQSPLPENNYTGSNVSRYTNPQFDAWIDRYSTTIDPAQRVEIATDIMRHMTDQALILGLFYTIEPILVRDKLVNVGPRTPQGTHAWNAHEWDVK